MSQDGIRFERNHASVSAIHDHLKRCDLAFTPPLSSRVNIQDYAKKIKDHAENFEVWNKHELIGLIAAYRDHEKRRAFITNVSVESAYRGKGFARILLEDCITYLVKQNFITVSLQVSALNTIAIHLYESFGFVVSGTEGDDLEMSLNLNENKT